ncbi:MAG: hypothetical protein ACRD0C_18095 [Acidimicrobiia bacterium]
MRVVPAGLPAYLGSLTWDDGGWRCCRICDVEWGGDGRCFMVPSHPGGPGRLRSWCPHGLRRVPGVGAPLCSRCECHAPADFTPEFMDALALTADRVRSAAGLS